MLAAMADAQDSFNKQSFAEMRHDPENAIQWRPKELAQVAQRVRDCRRCVSLNLAEPTSPFAPEPTLSAPGYGDPLSPVVIVGQSLCGAPCQKAQIPFTSGAGKVLDKGFGAARLTKSQIFITNVVHCHPQKNRASLPHEIANCAEYLSDELRIMHPRLIIALGLDAGTHLERWAAGDGDDWLISTGVPAPGEQKRVLMLAKHPSWVMKQPRPVREAYVDTFASALRWAFGT